jgi:GntR family transcriptional regulator
MSNDIVRPLKTNRGSLSTQALQYLMGLIEDGAYQPGEQLPSEADLAAQLGISRPTLREALLNLEQEGLVIRKHGVGTFITAGYESRLESGLERLESILELSARQGMQLTYDDLLVREEPAEPALCDRLQIDPGSHVTRVRRVILSEAKPVAYMVDVVPTAILPAAAIDSTFSGSVLDLLRQNPDLEIAQAVADIVALNADGRLAQRLAIEPGEAVLLLEEVLFDTGGRAIGCSRNCFLPGFFRFQIVRR